NQALLEHFDGRHLAGDGDFVDASRRAFRQEECMAANEAESVGAADFLRQGEFREGADSAVRIAVDTHELPLGDDVHVEHAVLAEHQSVYPLQARILGKHLQRLPTALELENAAAWGIGSV